jgi:hypothetical protein
MKYNRINIKWWLVSTSFKIYLDIPGSAPDIDLNMYIINVIADDESKIGMYEIYFLTIKNNMVVIVFRN